MFKVAQMTPGVKISWCLEFWCLRKLCTDTQTPKSINYTEIHQVVVVVVIICEWFSSTMAHRFWLCREGRWHFSALEYTICLNQCSQVPSVDMVGKYFPPDPLSIFRFQSLLITAKSRSQMYRLYLQHIAAFLLQWWPQLSLKAHSFELHCTLVY